MLPRKSETKSDDTLVKLERVHVDLALPEFDSLPAAAGLSNLEAFRLSLEHALALLPAMQGRVEPEKLERETRFAL